MLMHYVEAVAKTNWTELPDGKDDQFVFDPTCLGDE